MGSLKFRYTTEHKKLLCESVSYRQFLKTLLVIRSTPFRVYGYADLARSVGFLSRSYPRELILGKKNISLEALNKISKGMSLTKDLAQILTLLAELEHEELRLERRTVSKINQSLKNLKSRIFVTNEEPVLKEKTFVDYNIPKIYAALGSESQGASIQEIVLKTSLQKKEILSGLETMIEIGLATFRKNKFFASSNHMSLQHLSGKNFYKDYFRHNLKEIEANVEGKFDNGDCLFFSSTFSVNSSEIKNLKEDLRSILLKYVDESEEPAGLKIVTLNCSLL